MAYSLSLEQQPDQTKYVHQNKNPLSEKDRARAEMLHALAEKKLPQDLMAEMGMKIKFANNLRGEITTNEQLLNQYISKQRPEQALTAAE